jgi:hypothetical protein
LYASNIGMAHRLVESASGGYRRWRMTPSTCDKCICNLVQSNSLTPAPGCCANLEQQRSQLLEVGKVGGDIILWKGLLIFALTRKIALSHLANIAFSGRREDWSDVSYDLVAGVQQCRVCGGEADAGPQRHPGGAGSPGAPPGCPHRGAAGRHAGPTASDRGGVPAAVVSLRGRGTSPAARQRHRGARRSVRVVLPSFAKNIEFSGGMPRTHDAVIFGGVLVGTCLAHP